MYFKFVPPLQADANTFQSVKFSYHREKHSVPGYFSQHRQTLPAEVQKLFLMEYSTSIFVPHPRHKKRTVCCFCRFSQLYDRIISFSFQNSEFCFRILRSQVLEIEEHFWQTVIELSSQRTANLSKADSNLNF